MDEYTKEALEVVKAQASVRNISEEEITSMMQGIANQLKKLDKGDAQVLQDKIQEPPVDPKKAIKEKSVTCLECGKKFKVLTKRHLAKHGLTTQEYKEKWGYKKGTSLIAKSLARERKNKMEEMELWKRRKNVNIDQITNAVLQDFERKQGQDQEQE